MLAAKSYFAVLIQIYFRHNAHNIDLMTRGVKGSISSRSITALLEGLHSSVENPDFFPKLRPQVARPFRFIRPVTPK